MGLRDAITRLAADSTAEVATGALEFRIRRASPEEVAVLKHAALALPREALAELVPEDAAVPLSPEERAQEEKAEQERRAELEREMPESDVRALKRSDAAFVAAVVRGAREQLPDNYRCTLCGKEAAHRGAFGAEHDAACAVVDLAGPVVDNHPERWERIRLSATESTNADRYVMHLDDLPVGVVDLLAAEAALLAVGGAQGLETLRRFRRARAAADQAGRRGAPVRDEAVATPGG